MQRVKDETWGAYSVRDHTFEHPFAADVMLYDRLVVPVPPAAGSPEHALEWERWSREGWQPDLQERLLEILGERVVRVPWDAGLRAMWADEYHLRRDKRRLTTIFVLAVAGAGLTLAGAGPIGPIALGGAFVSVMEFAASELMPVREQPPSPAALLYDAKRQLGWKPPKDYMWNYLAFWRRFRR